MIHTIWAEPSRGICIYIHLLWTQYNNHQKENVIWLCVFRILLILPLYVKISSSRADYQELENWLSRAMSAILHPFSSDLMRFYCYCVTYHLFFVYKPQSTKTIARFLQLWAWGFSCLFSFHLSLSLVYMSARRLDATTDKQLTQLFSIAMPMADHTAQYHIYIPQSSRGNRIEERRILIEMPYSRNYTRRNLMNRSLKTIPSHMARSKRTLLRSLAILVNWLARNPAFRLFFSSSSRSCVPHLIRNKWK